MGAGQTAVPFWRRKLHKGLGGLSPKRDCSLPAKGQHKPGCFVLLPNAVCPYTYSSRHLVWASSCFRSTAPRRLVIRVSSVPYRRIHSPSTCRNIPAINAWNRVRSAHFKTTSGEAMGVVLSLIIGLSFRNAEKMIPSSYSVPSILFSRDKTNKPIYPALSTRKP